MRIANHRIGFTLLEALVAATLLMIILGVLTIIWKNAFRMADRTLAIMKAHQRARAALDLCENVLLERSGTMPLIAQGWAASRQFPITLGAWQSKAHIDLTSVDFNSAYTNEDVNNNNRLDKEDANGNGTLDSGEDTNGNGVLDTEDTNGNGLLDKWVERRWSKIPPNPAYAIGPDDPYAPGQVVKIASVGDWGWAWGMGRKFIRHSDIVKIDRTRRFLDTSAGLTASNSPFWVYPNVGLSSDNARYFENLSFGLGITTGSNEYPERWIHSLTTRYTKNSITKLTNGEMIGPYRYTAISPWVHKDATGTVRPTPWLGRTHIYRVASGPTFFRQPWTDGQWSPRSGGDYGVTTSSPTINGNAMVSGNSLEPDWNFVTNANWNPNALDAAIGSPRPEYGSIIKDGNLTWRCEAPSLVLWDVTANVDASYPGWRNRGMLTSAAQPASNIDRYRSVQLRNSLVVRWGYPDAAGLASGSAADSQGGTVSQRTMTAVTSIGSWEVRSARPTGTWNTGMNNAMSQAAQGRCGSLTLPGWMNNAGSNTGDPTNPAWNSTDGMTCGFPGAAPSADESPAHPCWTAVDFTVVGGLDRNGAPPITLNFTYALVLR